jgi:DHA2 family multidrug resistance protein-like MFS transporter
MVLLSGLPHHPQHIDIMWRLVFISAGSGTFFAPNARQIIFAAPMARAAAAGGLTQTTRMAGQVVGSTLTAAMLALGVGAGPLPALVAAALFSVSGLCCLVLLGFGPHRRN